MHQISLRIGKNTLVLLLVNGVGVVAGFLMAAALGRGLGDAGFGQYTLVMTWLLTFLLFIEFGFSTVLTRDLAASPDQTPAYLINSLAAKGLLGLPVAIILLFLAPLLATAQNPQIIDALRWGILFLYSGLFYSSFTAVFKARQTMLPILWLTLFGQVLLVTGTVILLLLEQPLYLIVVWAGISQTLQCMGALLLYSRSSNARITNIDPPLIKTLFIRAWPFALAGILAALQLRANILLLAYLEGDQAVGWYAAAGRFADAARQLPGAFYVAVLPAMSAMVIDRTVAPELRQTLRQARWGLLAYAGIVVVFTLVLAQLIISITYGPGYNPAVVILQILILSLIPAAQNNLHTVYLYARNDERFVNLLILAGIVINLGLCWWLIPRWGATGTAVALLLAECVLYILYLSRTRRRI